MSTPSRAVVLLVASALASTTCGSGGLPSIAPMGMTPTEASTIRAWRSQFVPRQTRQYDIRPWRFRNQRGSAAGRATVIIVPPDSLRFDYHGPFRRSGRAALVGDSALWVEPEEELGNLVGVAPLFWMAMGIPPHPPAGAAIVAVERPDLKAWRYADDGDTLTFLIRGAPATRMLGEIRRDGQTITLAEAELDPSTGYVRTARIEYPDDVSRFEFEVETVERGVVVDRGLWGGRR